jgi:anti-anti-sigma factor
MQDADAYGGMTVDLHSRGEAVHVAIHGEIDLDTAPRVRAELDELRSAGVARVVLDLRDVGFMDASGAALVLRASREMPGAFSVVPGDGQPRDLLALVGVLDSLPTATGAAGR